MQKILNTLFLLLTIGAVSRAQPMALTYYLPDIEYDASIPTPESFLGWQIGEWHLSHDQQYHYLRALAEASPRIALTEHGRTYEGRPLIYLTITAEKNHARLDQIRENHVALSDPARSGSLDVSAMPAVLYQGFSIHGNEPSGGNAAVLVAYYLAAGQSMEVVALLDNNVILLDPCYNPDGFQRFSTWANMHKNKNLTGDSQDREYNETWPRGRTNHYWFDINRDWLPVQHPEAQARIATFHRWKPNILTDHHEMGTNSTFFFMPGVPERTNPITPWENQELTKKIGMYHASALDEIGSLYYSEEGYDDFYYGKGSTYPDANGCIGILFEQASSRGHLQETENGLLSFPFTIRNQVKTALSTHQALREMREELLNYQRTFYRNALKDAQSAPVKGYVFGDPHDPGRVNALLEILRRHQIEVYELARSLTLDGQVFEPGAAYVVPADQKQYRLIRGTFETMTAFQDSLFYDISTWTLPLAFNLPYAGIGARAFSDALLGPAVTGLQPAAKGPQTLVRSQYAYLLEWNDYYAPRALTHILKNDLLAKVATQPFSLEGRDYSAGTVMIPVQNQQQNPEEVYRLVREAAEAAAAPVHAVRTGLTPVGIDLGSRDFEALRAPKVLLLVDAGVSGYEAGEVWHLLDQRYDLVVTMAETGDFNRLDLRPYNTIVMVDGSYGPINNGGVEKMRAWLRDGGLIIAQRDAVQWLQKKGLAHVTLREDPAKDAEKALRPYGKLEQDRGSEVIGGSIFRAELDLTHPLGYGFHRTGLPVFRRGSLFFERTRNPYATPLRYTEDPLLSGYIKAAKLDLLRGSAAAVVSGAG